MFLKLSGEDYFKTGKDCVKSSCINSIISDSTTSQIFEFLGPRETNHYLHVTSSFSKLLQEYLIRMDYEKTCQMFTSYDQEYIICTVATIMC